MLLVIGDKGVVSFETARELQNLNPRLRVQQIQDVGHGLQYDQPNRFGSCGQVLPTTRGFDRCTRAPDRASGKAGRQLLPNYTYDKWRTGVSVTVAPKNGPFWQGERGQRGGYAMAHCQRNFAFRARLVGPHDRQRLRTMPARAPSLPSTDGALDPSGAAIMAPSLSATNTDVRVSIS
jgi:hypothetical protein